MKPDMIVGTNATGSRIFKTPLYFEDFERGFEFELPAKKIEHDLILRFGVVTEDLNALHIDKEFAEKTIHGGIIAHGLLTLANLNGELHKILFWEKNIEALLGYDTVKFLKPIRPGDEIRHFLQVVEMCESQKFPDKGTVWFRFFTRNQKQKIVVEGNFSILIRKRAKN